MKKKEVFAWGMYDLANTIFSALFVTFFYPFYVKSFLGGNEFQIGLVFGLSMLAVGLVVPVIGAWSDVIGRRMPFIVFFTIVCCLLTWFVGKVSLQLALIAGFFANFAYHAALTTYNALLPKIASRREFGNVSGIGVGMGYLGTLVSLAVAALMLERLGWETEQGARAIFTATAVMFFGFSLFTFLGIVEKKSRLNHRTTWMHVRDSLRNVFLTLKNSARHRFFFLFMLSMFWYTNAINAVIVFLFLFARQQIQMNVQTFFVVYAIQSLGAVVGSFLSGRWVDRYGAKRVLVWAGFAWLLVITLLYFVTNVTMFIIAGVLGGAALGTVWTAQRPKLLEMVAHKDIGQFFGFLELTNKFSGVLGPIIFGALAKFVSYQAALISVAIFFILGLFCLRPVPRDKL
ncbi:MAG: MFS transporter [Candidatus Woesearchaeota archaeon]